MAIGVPSSRRPEKPRHQSGEPTPATTRSGSASASAERTSAGRKCPVSARAPPAAGWRELRMEPSGAVTASGAKLPSLFGTAGQSAAFTAKAV